MARRSSFFGTLEKIAREQARAQRQAEVDALRRQREQLRLEREKSRYAQHVSRVLKDQHHAKAQADVEERNGEIEERLTALATILEHTLNLNDAVPFASLRLAESASPFRPPAELGAAKPPPILEAYTKYVRPATFLERLLKLKRYDRDRAKAEQDYAAAHSQWSRAEQQRRSKLEALASEHRKAAELRLAEVRQRNQDVDMFEKAYENAEPDAILAYCSMVLERSQYPQGFPQKFRLAYVAPSREVVVDYELPGIEIVPATSEVRYIKSRQSIEEKPRKAAELKEIYQDIVASIAIRTIHELLESDQGGHIAQVVFNGFVNAVDRATGKDIRPCLISVRVTSDRFKTLDLARVDKRACLRNLGAQVSPLASELLPVKPLVEFDMVDKRFVEQGDILADLDARPNLIDLTPTEFEHLVSNLFARMGLEAKLTRSTRDGGVDVVAFDTRPIIGGKVVIQAKRYTHTVGVAAVRDLFGTMNHEGANKGILVSTSSYGPDAYDFIANKPIELIDGGGLLYYLEQVGVKARIVFRDDQAQAAGASGP